MKRLILVFLALALVAVSSGETRAGYMLVTSRSALGAADTVDWGQLGAQFSHPANPSTAISANGVLVSVSKTQPGSFERRDQSSAWVGNFAPGAHLLWTADFNTSPNILSIDVPFMA